MDPFSYLELEKENIYNVISLNVNNFLYCVFEFSLYTIAYIQLFCRNLFYIYFGEFGLDTPKYNICEYLWIKDGEIMYCDNNNNRLYEKENNKYSMLIIRDKNTYSCGIIKKYWNKPLWNYDSGNDISSDENNYLLISSNNFINNIYCSKVDYTFMNISLLYKNITYKMVLKSDYEYDFYQVGNIIDCDFIKYYLINVLYYPKEDILDDVNFDYILNIIDNKVNFKTLTKKNVLVFFKNIYLIEECIDNSIEKVTNIEQVEEVNYENIQHSEVYTDKN